MISEQNKDAGEAIKDLIVHSWHSKIVQTTNLWNKLAPAAMQQEIITGGNKVIYVLGHLLAVHDRMIEGMYLGERLYPDLDEIFLVPQTQDHTFPDPAALRTQWNTVNDLLMLRMAGLTMADWLSKHLYVSEQDFSTEPHRNVLNLLLSRTVHLANHNGQLLLVKPLA